ncbi:phosphatase inhibitor-domain-containing protein [Aspergillus venezuelensis]
MFSQSSAATSRVSSVSRVQEDTSNSRTSGTLRLRAEDETPSGQDEAPARRIRWSEDVVDNEGMGKKSSKVCCIYHKTRPVGESSSESESSDSDSSDSDGGPKAGNAGGRKDCKHHGHERDGTQGSSDSGRAHDGHSHGRKRSRQRKPSPNAYEKVPRHTKR